IHNDKTMIEALVHEGFSMKTQEIGRLQVV
ncbi:unnamed protein product, partial [marine sediment metagenome]